MRDTGCSQSIASFPFARTTGILQSSSNVERKGEKKEMQENEVFKEDFDTLKSWVKTHRYLPRQIPDELIAQFLFSCYSKLEASKKAIEAYYTMKTTSPEFFSNRDLDWKGLKQITEVVQICVLPEKTDMGYAVIWGRLIDCDNSKFNLDEAIKLLFMVVDAVLRTDGTKVKGLLFVFDNQGTTLGHLKRITLSSVRKYFNYVQEAMPIRLRGVLIINTSSVLTHIMTLIKPFIGKEQAKQISIFSQEQIANTYERVPKEFQPKDYGGGGPTMDTLFNDTLKSIRANSEWFAFDSTLRISDKIETKACLGGSFKKLVLD